MTITNKKPVLSKEVREYLDSLPSVGNLAYNPKVLARFNERFGGLEDTKYDNLPNEGEEVTGSNTTKALGINQVLIEDFPELNERVLTLEQALDPNIWKLILDPKTYGDFASLSVYPNEHKNRDNEELRRQALSLIGIKSTDVPLVISYPGIAQNIDNKSYGFSLTKINGVNPKIIESPGLEKNQRVKYDPETNQIVASENGVYAWTPEDPSGIRGVYRDWVGDVDARFDNLLSSNSIGRVPIISGGAASPDLEEKLE